ncbi:hypothetical protein ACFFWB_27385 [Flavobacterium procerum]|uniref:hypothetical protein n=1 Tax=Flavobacterium procerum TaxID=1455569 RepID=UPI0035EA1F34
MIQDPDGYRIVISSLKAINKRDRIMSETHKKILFKYYSDYLDEVVSETMWQKL